MTTLLWIIMAFPRPRKMVAFLGAWELGTRYRGKIPMSGSDRVMSKMPEGKIESLENNVVPVSLCADV